MVLFISHYDAAKYSLITVLFSALYASTDLFGTITLSLAHLSYMITDFLAITVLFISFICFYRFVLGNRFVHRSYVSSGVFANFLVQLPYMLQPLF